MNIYFSGIGGVGIGPLAEIALDAGYEVLGSDPEESLITKELKKRNIKISSNQDGSFLADQNNLKPIDLLVYTAALPSDHPELLMAKRLNITAVKRDELIARIIKEKNLKLIAIAGTHGKTTTTGMMMWVLQHLNIPISYSIGTTINFGPSGKFDKRASYFIYECDEFDKNFLHFQPYLSIITSIDYDHPDTYPTKDVYLDAFRQFGLNSESIITWEDQHGELFSSHNNAVIVSESQINNNLLLAGKHNRKNATLAQIATKKLGFSQNTDDIINCFPGTNRRFEKLADNLYSDYGHHPVEIAATLQMAREISDHVVLVYQPHQNIRQHNIKDQYTSQFELADDIYWLPTYLSREDPALPILQPSQIIEKITNIESVHEVDFNDELWNIIQKARLDGKMVLAMGAGKIDSWIRSRLNGQTTL